MNRQLDRRDSKIIGEQAAQWVCDLREVGADREAFLAWVKQSPQHVREFLFAATVWRETQAIAANDSTDLDALVAALSESEKQGSVVAITNQPLLPAAPSTADGKRHRARMLFAAGIAALLMIAVTGWFVLPSGRAQSYVTGLGEQRTIRLSDGSLLQLNTQSQIEISYSRTARDVRLIDGEVLLTVQADAARPFRVHSAGTLIQALGTQFNVYRRADGTKISVIEGAVRVTAPPGNSTTAIEPRDDRAMHGSGVLNAGEEAKVAADGRIVKQTVAEIGNVVAWRDRRLVFQGQRLAEIAAQFNRYNPRQIQVMDQAARDKLLSGTFNADDPGSLIVFLTRLEDLTVDAAGGQILIQSR